MYSFLFQPVAFGLSQGPHGTCKGHTGEAGGGGGGGVGCRV